MQIRLAQCADISSLESLFYFAKQKMREQENHYQWSGNYPSKETILNDIKNKQLYVAISNSQIVGAFSFLLGEDPTYKEIHRGKWLNNDPYATIHRIASNGTIKNFTRKVIEWCWKYCTNIRIDTHPANKAMIHILEDLGFTKCGFIYSEDAIMCIAFHKIKEEIS